MAQAVLELPVAWIAGNGLASDLAAQCWPKKLPSLAKSHALDLRRAKLVQKDFRYV